MTLPTPLVLKAVEWRTGARPPAPLHEAIARIAPRPLLLITTGLDYEKRQSEWYYQFAGDPKSLWNIPEAAHTGGPMARPAEYETKIVSFFEQALLK